MGKKTPPQAGERGQAGDAGALGLAATAEVQAAQGCQRGERRQVSAAADALAVLQLERAQLREACQREQPAQGRE